MELSTKKGIKAMNFLEEKIVKEGHEKMVITHCNNVKRAETVRDLILSKTDTIKQVIIMDTAGVASLYAADGGVIVTI